MTGLSDEAILELGEFLEDRRDQDQCCRGLLCTQQWIANTYGRSEPAILNWINQQQVTCDCEVMTHLVGAVARHRRETSP